MGPWNTAAILPEPRLATGVQSSQGTGGRESFSPFTSMGERPPREERKPHCLGPDRRQQGTRERILPRPGAQGPRGLCPPAVRCPGAQAREQRALRLAQLPVKGALPRGGCPRLPPHGPLASLPVAPRAAGDGNHLGGGRLPGRARPRHLNQHKKATEGGGGGRERDKHCHGHSHLPCHSPAGQRAGRAPAGPGEAMPEQGCSTEDQLKSRESCLSTVGGQLTGTGLCHQPTRSAHARHRRPQPGGSCPRSR